MQLTNETRDNLQNTLVVFDHQYGTIVTDMMSYMRALSTFKKGDKTKVVVQRGEESVEKLISF